MNNAGYMFEDQKEFLQLQAGIFGYLQRDIDKMLDKHDLDAEFVNFSQSERETGVSWILMKVYYTWYEDEDDMIGKYDNIKVAYRLGKSLYTRDPEAMRIIDQQAKLAGRQDRLSDIDLVKLRILYTLFQIIKCVQEDGVPLDFAGTKKYLIVRQNDDGTINWKKEATLPWE